LVLSFGYYSERSRSGAEISLRKKGTGVWVSENFVVGSSRFGDINECFQMEVKVIKKAVSW
jgi:hypothetical protein